VYASQRPSRATTQDSLPAAGQALPGRIGYLQDPDEKFPSASYISSSFPKLPGANDVPFSYPFLTPFLTSFLTLMRVRQGYRPHPPHGSRSQSFTVLSSLTDAIVWPFPVIAREYISPWCVLNANTTSPVFTLYRPIVAFFAEDCGI